MERKNRRERDLKNTYLWVDREDQYGEDYEEVLLYKKEIPGLLSFYEVEEDGEKGLVYNLQGKISWIENIRDARMRCSQIECFIYALVDVLEAIDEYLLDPSNLVVEMEYIFGNRDRWEFVYIPGYHVDFWRQMEKLGEEWLSRVDYGDERAVLWVYTFYKKVHEPFCAVGDLVEILRMEKKKPDRPQEKEIQEGEEQAMIEHQTVKKKVGIFDWIAQKLHKKDGEDDFFKVTEGMGDTETHLDIKTDVLNMEEGALLLIPVGDNQMNMLRVDHYPVIVGRSPEEADLCLNNPKVSRLHARIDVKGRDKILVDMNSSNGTYLNDERMKAGQAYILHTGDTIRIADIEYMCQ